MQRTVARTASVAAGAIVAMESFTPMRALPAGLNAWDVASKNAMPIPYCMIPYKLDTKRLG